MRVGVVAEIKPAERRVGLTPAGASALVEQGHKVIVETSAGVGAGYSDAHYRKAGGSVVSCAESVWAEADLVVKVKEPVGPELDYLRSDLTLFTFLHLAANRGLTEALVGSGVTAIGYETVRDARRRLPLLAPMSEIAGSLAAHAAAHILQHVHGGPGILIGGAPGVRPARVLVVGGGAVGARAAEVAVGMGANVTILERSLERVRELKAHFGPRLQVLYSDRETLLSEAHASDVIVGAVLVPGAATPRILRRPDLATVGRGRVLIDVAIDQGGCFETSHPTTHDEPTFVVDHCLHYCVANMPGAVPVTATGALTNATLPYVLELARGHLGPELAEGLNVRQGRIVHEEVAAGFQDLPARPSPPAGTFAASLP
jgi:alanine dehydrogenase